MVGKRGHCFLKQFIFVKLVTKMEVRYEINAPEIIFVLLFSGEMPRPKSGIQEKYQGNNWKYMEMVE